jgi:hypothetical protein
LGRDATAIDGDTSAAVDGERRLIAKIDAIDLGLMPVCPALSVVQFVAP